MAGNLIPSEDKEEEDVVRGAVVVIRVMRFASIVRQLIIFNLPHRQSTMPTTRSKKKPTKKKGPKFVGQPKKQAQCRAIKEHIARTVMKLKDEGKFKKGMLTEEVEAYNDTLDKKKLWLTNDMISKTIAKLRRLDKKEKEASAEAATVATEDAASEAEVEVVPRIGRPKGTTKAEMKFREDVVNKFKDVVTRKYSDYRQMAKMDFKHRRKNYGRTFEQIKKDVADQFAANGLDYCSNVAFSKEAAEKRISKRRIENVGRSGGKPIAPEMEAVLAMMCKQASRANHALTQREVIELANGLVDEGPLRDIVIARKKKTNFFYREKYKDTPATSVELGAEWFRGFIKRFDELTFDNQTLVERSRDSWCNFANVRFMYKKLYDQWLQDGYIKLVSGGPHHQDINGKRVARDDPTRVGRLIKYEWKHADRMLCADEVGYNTNFAKDKPCHYDKAVMETARKAKVPSSTTNIHFTNMCFTSFTGEPVLFVTIVPSSCSFSLNMVLGCDVTVDWIGDKSVFEEDGTRIPAAAIRENIGPGKRFGGGVTCRYKGKEIPMLVLKSQSSSNNSALLTEMLKYIDELEVFERNPDLPPPGLLVDGHGSRFGKEFLTYVSNKDIHGNVLADANHEWNVYMGLPNCTGVWQVGDSSQQNGMFKTKLREKATEIQKNQRLHSKTPELREEHIIPMCMHAFPHSFGNVETNKRALAERGWSILNRNCLFNEDVIHTKVATTVYESDAESVQDNSFVGTPASATTLSTLTNYSVSDLSASTVASPFAASTNFSVDASIAQLKRQRVMTKSERDLELRPHVIDLLGVSCYSSMNLQSFLAKSHNRDVAFEKKFREDKRRREEQYDENLEQIAKTKKMKTGAGKEHSRGNFKISAKFVLDEVLEKNAQQDGEEMRKQVKKYEEAACAYQQGLALIERGPDPRRNEWTSAELLTLIKFKRLGMSNEALKGKPIPVGKQMRHYNWETLYKTIGHPAPPVKPEGFDAYVITRFNIELAEKRMKAFGLPWNERSKDVQWLRSHKENEDDFVTPTLNDHSTEDGGGTTIGFARGLSHAYGDEVFASEWRVDDDDDAHRSQYESV